VAIYAGDLTGERVILQGATCHLRGRLDIGCQAVPFLNFLYFTVRPGSEVCVVLGVGSGDRIPD